MPPPDSSEVDAAIAARLANDATLKALLPGGVFFDVAAPNADKFVLISALTHSDEGGFQDVAREEFLYLVKAVTLGTSGAEVKSAAARIDVLLHDAQLQPVGYLDMFCRRVERIRLTEVDEVTDARWQHRGGHYAVWVQPIGT